MQSLPLFSSVLQITTKQCQFIKSLFIRLLFYIPDYSHCFPQCHSSLSRPFVKCYPQNCRDFKLYHHPAKQRLHHMPCRLNSYLYVQVQHLPLSQQYTTTFSLWSSFILSQSFSAELWSSWSFSALFLCSLLFLPRYNSLHLSLLNYIMLFQCTSSLSRTLRILILSSNKFTVPPPAFCHLQI